MHNRGQAQSGLDNASQASHRRYARAVLEGAGFEVKEAE